MVLSFVLAAAALVDQLGGRSLSEHANVMYAPYDKTPDPALLYGLLHGTAGLGALLWLAALGHTRTGGRFALLTIVLATSITAALAVTLLVVGEYGTRLFPPVWGGMAALPPLAGLVAIALTLQRRQSTS